MNIEDLIDQASEEFRHAGIDQPRREAASLLTFVLGRDRAFLVAHPEHRPEASQVAAFRALAARRADREPFHYITGEREFFGRDFLVEPGVLIPRPETELLVESAIEFLRTRNSPSFLEIGVGSGCISVSVLAEVAEAKAIAVDVSPIALRVAGANAARHGVVERLELLRGDLFAAVNQKFDLIVSNPPYIPDNDLATLQPEVAKFEPHIALFAGDDGLEVVERIINEAGDLLLPGGVLLIEIGFGQADKVRDLLERSGWSSVEFIEDLQGIQRVAKARVTHSGITR